MILELDIKVNGNFSNLFTKDEYKFLNKSYNNGLMEYTCKRRKHGNVKFTQTVTLCGTSFIISDSKDIRFKGRFIGLVKEVEGGFIPNRSVTQYRLLSKNKVYKTFEDAERSLIEKRYKEIEKRSFGYLAQKKFYYTEDYLNNLSINEMARLIEQFTNDILLAIRIVKKFLKRDIIGYYGQGGYETTTQKIY